MLAQMTVWDTENDAREFLDAYAKRTRLRYEKATETAASAEAGEGERHMWNTSEGRVMLEMRGKRVLMLEGIPEAGDANSLLKALWE